MESCWTILASADTSVDVAGSGELLLLLLLSLSKGVGMVSVTLDRISPCTLEASAKACWADWSLSFSTDRASSIQLVSVEKIDGGKSVEIEREARNSSEDSEEAQK